MWFLSRLSLLLFCVTISSMTATAREPVTLIGTIVKWRYPEAEIGKSSMSDAATMDADGKRTVPSIVLATTMLTDDSVEKVVAFYRTLLARSPENDVKLGLVPQSSVSVLFNDESVDRTFSFHTILVNATNVSTVLIITRGNDESKTHITWKQYRTFTTDE